MHNRVIPCLLLEDGGLVKTVQFNRRTYLGDPINIIRIFNDKEVDEVVLLDIAATRQNREPDYAAIEKIASQCFMPLSYGGGIRSMAQIRRLYNLGVEKISLNAAAATHPDLIGEAATVYGRQAVIVSLDAKRNWRGRYEVMTHGGTKGTGRTPVEWAQKAVALGCGELLVNSIDRDGMMNGYDVELIKSVTEAASVPVIACGGASRIEDFGTAVKQAGAAAVAAGSLFVFHGKHRAVLINYPTQDALKAVMS